MNYDIQESKIEEQVEKQSGNFRQYVSVQESEREMRLEILNYALKTANEITKINEQHENKKSFWRAFFVISFCSLLLASFTIIIILLFFEKLSDAQLGILASTIIAEIIAIILFMVKYVHNDLYLETFKTVTQNLLDYLIQDKSENENVEKKL